jgi:hypothetical protein
MSRTQRRSELRSPPWGSSPRSLPGIDQTGGPPWRAARTLAGKEQVAGPLDIYAGRRTPSTRPAGRWPPGSPPTRRVTAGTVQAHRSARKAADNLRIALESRAVIEQAKGILIERHKLTPDRAFEALVPVSMSRNVKVRDIAEHLVLTGGLPLVRTRSAPIR